MNNANENLLPEQQIVQVPEQQIVQTLEQESNLMGIINIFDDNEIMPFKLYENVKSRPVSILRYLIFSEIKLDTR